VEICRKVLVMADGFIYICIDRELQLFGIWKILMESICSNEKKNYTDCSS